MPKSPRPHSRLRDFIREARNISQNPDNAPAIATVLLGESMWPGVKSDEEVLRILAAGGVNASIRAYLARFGSNDTAESRESRDRQLELWSFDAKELVQQINRERVWVPSRDEFVELVPDALNADEIREAGRYLIAHGKDCIRRGEMLIALADLHTPPNAQAA